MTDPGFRHLSRREREIMDIVYAQASATAGEILERLHAPPGYSAVRALLRILVEKGELKARRDGVRNVYAPVRARRVAQRSAMKRALETFFSGDLRQAVTTLIEVGGAELSVTELQRISKLIDAARRKGQ